LEEINCRQANLPSINRFIYLNGREINQGLSPFLTNSHIPNSLTQLNSKIFSFYRFKHRVRFPVGSTLVIFAVLLLTACSPPAGKEAGNVQLASENWSVRMAGTIMKDHPELWRMEDYNIDNINPGKMLFPLFEETGDKRYETVIHTLSRQLADHPRTDAGGFWHKKRYPHQMWLDGLYMGSVFYARYGKEYNEPENLADAANWIILMEEKARDPKTGLLHHAWDESRDQRWADSETGLSGHFRGRGMGCYSMALVDILDYLDADSRRDEVIGIVRRTAEAIVRFQDKESGVWYQVLDMAGREGNYLEGSVSSMFAYFLLKAIKKGYIDESYYAYARKAYQGILDRLMVIRKDGGTVITPVCAVAGLGGDPYRDGSYEYYINEKRRENDPKAAGPFILASLLYEELEKGWIHSIE
jgi:unsaturated rhamnogalacturonyl hydrolase